MTVADFYTLRMKVAYYICVNKQALEARLSLARETYAIPKGKGRT